MAHLFRRVTTAAVTLLVLGPLANVQGQGRGVLSPEVTANRSVIFRLQAANARSVQVLGDFTAKSHDMQQIHAAILLARQPVESLN